MINVKEKSVISKRADGKECEDGLFINDSFICVIDGVTSKGKWTWDGHTSGYYAKELILKGMEDMPADVSGEEAIQRLNQCIADGYTPERREEALHNSDEKIQANIIIYSANKKQLWCFGDCQCIINGKFFAHEKNLMLSCQICALFISSLSESAAKPRRSLLLTIRAENLFCRF